MKSQSRRAESLSRRSLSREHSRALLWENLITSTLCVSSLMTFCKISLHSLVTSNISSTQTGFISENLSTYLTRGPGKPRRSAWSGVSCRIVCQWRNSSNKVEWCWAINLTRWPHPAGHLFSHISYFMLQPIKQRWLFPLCCCELNLIKSGSFSSTNWISWLQFLATMQTMLQ